MPLPASGRLRRIGLAAAAAAACTAAGLSVPSTASGASATETVWETGTVIGHSDGDTPYVDIAGNGVHDHSPIRLIGVNSTEIRHTINGHTRGKNWCHGLAAKRRALQLMPRGSKVTMRSMHRSSYSGVRRQRTVFVKRPNGSWLNVQRTLLTEGHVVWFPHPSEWLHNREYHLLAEQAVRAGRNIWNKTYCGYGPRQSARLKVFVHYDANGSDDADNAHRNGEYVIIRNEGGAGTVGLGGWYVRDTALAMYRIPSGTRLRVGQELRVHSGRGQRDAHNLYWGQSRSIFGEPKQPGMGDGAFLLDPQGDFRAWSMYPCVISCSDPREGKLRITSVTYDIPGGDSGKEKVVIANRSSASISLGHLQLRSWPWNYVFPSWLRLGAGRSMTVHIVASRRHPNNTATDRYWYPGIPSILNDDTDQVDVSTLTDVTVDCTNWNNGSGPTAPCHY